MSVWYCIPSCRPIPEVQDCLERWRAQGYKIALLRQGDPVECDLLIPTGEYLGWARSTNILTREVLRRDSECTWVCAGGDDYWPDPTKPADEIAEECSEHFRKAAWPMCWHWDSKYNTPEEALAAGAYAEQKPQALWSAALADMFSTWGVCQPTGDRYGDSPEARKEWGEERGAEIDRIAGSPWMGREWCKSAYLGIGPLWPGYHHLYADEELCAVAEKLGVYWRRRDLTQYHNHPCRTDPKGYGVYREGHLAKLYDPERWRIEQMHFEERKAKGFPGCEPCPR